ncbi:hypothetical protein PCANC_00431 [Puccinia coronata f. sp. avenae]|uniref:Conidiation-specific protein 6 n=1 Tax=Puccinia coronata f. sp. avenae TaxID=200324 RepID=A0A2N5VQ38_9BASI|nr:hypothetical protein PCANC_11955 [Puccinia coronata f. sp. avenae]PLW24452.1 hypothetical protein PCASD_11587 [Puccinia coronata f. sp. avenae]PLW52125.1 hypothetical protein PCASD_02075 [Puccinia coronata f. sp. avenae]PLW58895.1 hypothetical protein PCANC_00431 [Puccinia coronata f. sp. avenae]
MANPGHVAGGLKGVLNNPNVSDERRERDDHRLEAAEFKPTPTLQEHGKNDESMTRGMKGALHSSTVSEEKKQDSRHKLDF